MKTWFVLLVIYVAGVIYLVQPIPTLPTLDSATLSNEEGDTWQNPDQRGYYTNLTRSQVLNQIQTKSEIKIFGWTVPNYRLNYRPEEAHELIRDQLKSNYMEEIIVEMDNQSDLDKLKESDFDWFNLGPQLVITRINEIDLSVIHDYFLNKAHSTQVTELLAIEEDEIDDYVSDFIQSTRYEISKEEFDNITNADSEAVDSSDEEEEEEENDDGLVIPINLVVQNYNSAWGRYIILTYANSSDCEEENFKIKMDTVTNSVLPFNIYADELTKKWFNSWEALLSSDNKQSYSSSIPISFTNAENDFMSSDVEWGIIWHDQFEDLADGKFPEGVSADTINKLFSNEWFSQLFSFVEQNGF